MSGAFIISDAGEKRWRTWGDSGPEWTADRDAALRFARRQDAERFSAEDEDAWHIVEVEADGRVDGTLADRVRRAELAASRYHWFCREILLRHLSVAAMVDRAKALIDEDPRLTGAAVVPQHLVDLDEKFAEAEDCWRDFWAPIVAPNGVLDVEQVKKELRDFSMLLAFAPKVYCHVTGDAIGNPLTLPSVVCAVADDYESRVTIAEALEEERQGWQDALPAQLGEVRRDERKTLSTWLLERAEEITRNHLPVSAVNELRDFARRLTPAPTEAKS